MTTTMKTDAEKAQVLRWITDVGIVPVVRAPSAALALRAVEALMAGGISVFEITMTVPGAVEVIRELAGRLRGQAIVGAGTVLTPDVARACLEAGAQFIVSPGLNPDVVAAARAANVAVMPGALTPTEVIAAVACGADMVKIFPCSAVGGPSYLKALKGPLPDVKLLPTGGVNANTALSYFEAGASAVGVGGELVDMKALQAGDDAGLTARARALVGIVRDARARKAGAA